MKKLFKRIEDTMAAVAFAEAGEADTARQILDENKPRKPKRQAEYRQARQTSRKTLRAE